LVLSDVRHPSQPERRDDGHHHATASVDGVWLTGEYSTALRKRAVVLLRLAAECGAVTQILDTLQVGDRTAAAVGN